MTFITFLVCDPLSPIILMGWLKYYQTAWVRCRAWQCLLIPDFGG
jgi:hypothetical protein